MSDVRPHDVQKLRQHSAADQIDLICDAFEEAWARNETPLVEDYLDRCDRLAREAMLTELLLVDREYRIRRGETPSRQAYRDRFPDYSTVIDRLEFATIDDRLGSPRPTHRDHSGTVCGSRIAQFELLEALGSGASGEVWKARDTRLRRLVAVKLPRKDALTGLERERFLREGQACAQLRHPNIVAVHEVGEDRGRVFIVAQLIDGMNLRAWMSRRRPTSREAAELAAQLAEALHHAHEQGVIHRDLKPANVLMDNEGRPHVTDFGLAKWSASSTGMTVDGHILGTPAYMSPEQARGDAARVDRRTDVYGLGALLYEMLASKPPFAGDVAAIVHQAIHNEPSPPRRIAPSVPRELETICLKAMEKVASRRYPSAQEMAVDLRRFLRGEPILARRVGRLEKGWHWVRRRPAVAASIVLSLFVALAGMTIASLTEQNFKLQGYRTVRITTQPAGACVALVPIDERTGEPNSDPTGIIRPAGLTPLSTLAKPGEYFIEAVLPGDKNTFDFAEVRVTIGNPGESSKADLTLGITIERTEEICANLVAVPIDEGLRRKNALLPKILYVDAKETTLADVEAAAHWITNEEGNMRFEAAKNYLSHQGKRLPSATEYDAIVDSIKKSKLMLNGSGEPIVIEGLSNGIAEWTTTRYDFPGTQGGKNGGDLRNMIVLKGIGETEAPADVLRAVDGQFLTASDAEPSMIGCRGVRSDAPRFVER